MAYDTDVRDPKPAESCKHSTQQAMPGWMAWQKPEFRMGKRRDDAHSRKPKKKRDKAFDLWLKRGLHQMFDNVANEPVPEELLKLIQEDREKQD